MIVKMSHRHSLMCRLQSEDGEYNGMCCHDGVPLCFRPRERMDALRPSVNSPSQQRRSGNTQTSQENLIKGTVILVFAFFLLHVSQSQPDTNNNATLCHQPRSWCHRLQKCFASNTDSCLQRGWHVKLYLIKGKKLTRVRLSVLHGTP